ncbi:MAG: TrkA C-terminal domain-containing protein, partial [Burkholderiales bacterium]
RATTGATVLAILRGGQEVVVPAAAETIRAGDLLALAGSDVAIEQARTLLVAGASAPRDGGIAGAGSGSVE